MAESNEIVNVNDRQEILNLKKTKIAIKRTSLMIDELELKREEEDSYKLTTHEQNQYDKLKFVFKEKPKPSDEIQEAIDTEENLKSVRKDYLTAAKVHKERQSVKDNLDNDSVGTMLLASSVPIVFIGAMLLDSFKLAGVFVIIAGVTMSVPVFIKEITKKRKAKKQLKQIDETLADLSEEIYEKSAKVDNVCSEYGVPINCIDKEIYMEQLLKKAKEYESYNKKQSEYENIVKANRTDELSNQISTSLKILSGVQADNEKEYSELMKVIEEQFNVTSAKFRIEEKTM